MTSPNTIYNWKPLSTYEESTQEPFKALSSIQTLSNEDFVTKENKSKIQDEIDFFKKDLSAVFFPHRENNLKAAHTKLLSKVLRLKKLFKTEDLKRIEKIPEVTKLFKNFVDLEKSIKSSLSKTNTLLTRILPTPKKTENSQKNLKHFANWIQETISNVLSSFAFCSTPPLHWQVFASNVIL